MYLLSWHVNVQLFHKAYLLVAGTQSSVHVSRSESSCCFGVVPDAKPGYSLTET